MFKNPPSTKLNSNEESRADSPSIHNINTNIQEGDIAKNNSRSSNNNDEDERIKASAGRSDYKMTELKNRPEIVNCDMLSSGRDVTGEEIGNNNDEDERIKASASRSDYKMTELKSRPEIVNCDMLSSGRDVTGEEIGNNNDEDERIKASASHSVSVLSAMPVFEDEFVEATKIDPQLELQQRQEEMDNMLHKERQEVGKTLNKRTKKRYVILAIVILILIATTVTLSIIVSRNRKDGGEDKPPPHAVFAIRGNSFLIEAVEDDGRSFSLPVSEFILPFDSIEPDENGEIKTTLRVRNARTNTTKTIIVKKKSDTVAKGWYNPSLEGQPDDFQVGDNLIAIDYAAFTTTNEGSGTVCNRVPFHIIFTTSSGSDILDGKSKNLRIGHVGMVGDLINLNNTSKFRDFDVQVEVDQPVSQFWTDAIDSDVEIMQPGSWASWGKPIPSIKDSDPTLHPFQEPLTGRFRICFKDVGFDDLNGLVSSSEGGGLHIAFCT